jgi:pyruvate/2-oxoglutarate dehydrogenase complex dihydrolipoamide acyltransferase (E2) component
VSSSRTEHLDADAGAVAEAGAGAGGSAGAGALTDVTMPQMGVSVVEGTVVGWRVEPGDRIEADQTICDISTDKIDTEVPAPVSGVVAEILVPVEATVEVGVVLARIATGAVTHVAAGGEARAGEPGNGLPQPEVSLAGDAGPAPEVSIAGDAGPAPGGSEPAAHPGEPSRHYSPVVQRIAAEHDIDLSQVPGTGRGGRVRKQDVLALVNKNGDRGDAAVEEPPMHIESPYRPDPPAAVQAGTAAAAPVAAQGGTRAAAPVAAQGGTTAGEPGALSRMRRQIGQHMKRSLDTAATCTTWIEVDMGRVQAARARLGVTALAFVARATIESLREHPSLNAWLEEDRYTRHQEVNLGIAVSLGEDGLIVPVLHRAHEFSVEGLAARIKDLAVRARSRELTPDEVRGGTFTITNPGQFGSIMATPIINQPQVGILDFEAVVKRPVVVTDADGNDSIAIRPMTILGLSWDHRALDGVMSAQFLASVKRRLEAPGT